MPAPMFSLGFRVRVQELKQCDHLVISCPLLCVCVCGCCVCVVCVHRSSHSLSLCVLCVYMRMCSVCTYVYRYIHTCTIIHIYIGIYLVIHSCKRCVDIASHPLPLVSLGRRRHSLGCRGGVAPCVITSSSSSSFIWLSLSAPSSPKAVACPAWACRGFPL